MEVFDLRPGTPIEFEFASTNSDIENNIEDDRSVYISSVFGITKKGEVIFHIPTRKGHIVTIPMDVPFNAIFNTKKGLFQLTGVITKRGRLENYPVYVLEPMNGLKKVQRRDYYRLQCLIPIMVLPIPEEVAILPNMELVEADLERYGNTYGIPVSGTILDISGGGAKFNSDLDVITERYMYVSFKLVSNTINHTINAIAKRVRSEYKTEKRIYEHRIEFLFKEPEDRETIIKYIFDEERRIRKKDQG
ncbi:c-di-GMP-binding flagellar brake protein YcgR, contains PilZNR and PilZ domains [Pseudobutyrivibrio sp. ACV-2]|uniref:flagellar brake protein n=1 Tax=Pseudobutyrivibrio sp. ACV-2 TaxID=1520801 RepID=UPI00089AE906|nr:flagellar brake domain-containing protein [Pseudobutyrivibrio sp. ACV-2]SDZ85379.1 c-di-GMP-binding flagellar brake protein YcgR, contains PilZNR and PilZ domains [Pseudobutyrivibrio sp. ACV-2]